LYRLIILFAIASEIYVAGYGRSSATNQSCALLWIDAVNEPIALSSYLRSIANSVYVADGSYYVAGWRSSAASRGERGVIWKDGVEIPLGQQQYTRHEALSCFVADGYTFACGVVSPYNSDGPMSGALWITKGAIDIYNTYTVSGSSSVRPEALYYDVLKKRLYMAGHYASSDGVSIAALWEMTFPNDGGGVTMERLVRLSSEETEESWLHANAYSVYVLGDDVYVAGQIQAYGSRYPQDEAAIWKGVWGGTYTAAKPNDKTPSVYESVFVK